MQLIYHQTKQKENVATNKLLKSTSLMSETKTNSNASHSLISTPVIGGFLNLNKQQSQTQRKNEIKPIKPTSTRNYLKLLENDHPVINLATNNADSLPPPAPPSHTVSFLRPKSQSDNNLIGKVNISLKAKRKVLETLRSDSFTSYSSCNLSDGAALISSTVLAAATAIDPSHVSTKLPYNCIITVDTSKARSNAEVLKMCMSELSWQECPEGLVAGCDIIWQSCTSHEGRDQFVNATQTSSSRINKFPCKYFLRM